MKNMKHTDFPVVTESLSYRGRDGTKEDEDVSAASSSSTRATKINSFLCDAAEETAESLTSPPVPQT